MKTLIISALLSIGASSSFAQKQWTLPECINYAIEHNINLKQRENSRRQNELSLNTAKNSRLPDLNANVNENLGFGRSIGMDNTYSKNNTSSTSFQINTSLPILTGNRIENTIKLNQLNLEASTADLEKARNDIRTQIAQQYIQIVYDREMLAVAKRQISIDSMQVYRLQEMERNGKATLTEVLQQQSTMAQSQLTATQAENTYRLDLLALSQLLELPTPEGFSIVIPSLPSTSGTIAIFSPDAIFQEALATKPEIQAEQLRLKATDANILIAKSAKYPTLSLNAGLSTNYYKTLNGNFKQDSFGSQLKNNFSQNIGLSLNVPIFNRYSTRNNIRSASIDRENQQLALDNVKKSLYKEIQQVYYNAIAAEAKYTKSLQAEETSKAAFDLTQAKYENGKATITEFNESKNNLMKAESDLVQARYELIYQKALVDFYRGKEL
ncbi:MAG: TolC family protein, partial [Prevotellaceae bacterium]|nr:TolC family protein [Prevotellaceae bacterium]